MEVCTANFTINKASIHWHINNIFSFTKILLFTNHFVFTKTFVHCRIQYVTHALQILTVQMVYFYSSFSGSDPVQVDGPMGIVFYFKNQGPVSGCPPVPSICQGPGNQGFSEHLCPPQQTSLLDDQCLLLERVC